jgi:hypothetical protein
MLDDSFSEKSRPCSLLIQMYLHPAYLETGKHKLVHRHLRLDPHLG